MFVVGKCESCSQVLSKIGDECLVSTVSARAAAQFFLGNLATTVYNIPCSTTVHYCITGVITSTRCTARIVLKDEQLMPIQHIYNGKDVLVWLTDTASCCMVLLFVSVPRIHAEKAEAAYHRHRLGHCTTGLHGVAARCSGIFH